MKTAFLIILTALCLAPSLAWADAGGAGQGAIDNGQLEVCASFNCACTWRGSFLGNDRAPTSVSECSASCLETIAVRNSGGDPMVESEIDADYQCLDANGQVVSIAQVSEPTTPAEDPVLPCLNVPIPGLSFGDCDSTGKDPNADPNIITNTDATSKSNLLGLYVNAVYGYLLIAASIIAVTMLMIAGLQYATARGDSHQVDAAKKRISNAVVGIIILLLAYNIAFLIDPATTTFNSLSLEHVAEMQLDNDVEGPEGEGTFGATGTWENLSSPYRDIVSRAKTADKCDMAGGFASPTTNGTLPNQGNHHWFDAGRNGDFTKINNLDWSASWGSEIKAPFAGTVTYQQQSNTKNKCGNRIYLHGATMSITICHAKDFLNANNEYISGASVAQGAVIGHVGGECCSGGAVPNGWITQCDVSGTPCTDPTSANASCSCQPIAQSGNTTGPHIHVTQGAASDTLLSCLN